MSIPPQPSVKSHDSLLTEHASHPLLPVDYCIPGLPPVPQLPPPPNQDAPDYPSTLDESVTVLLSRPETLATPGDGSASKEVRHLASEDSELKQHKGPIHSSASGLSTSKRVALYMETAQEKGLLASKESACSKTRSAKLSTVQTANAKKCASTSTVSVARLPIASTVVERYRQQVSRDLSMAQTRESEAIPASARIVHSSQITVS